MSAITFTGTFGDDTFGIELIPNGGGEGGGGGVMSNFQKRKKREIHSFAITIGKTLTCLISGV